MSEHEQFVKQALAAAGVQPTDAEIETLIGLYPGFRAMAARLCAVPGVMEEESELQFDARTTWAQSSIDGREA